MEVEPRRPSLAWRIARWMPLALLGAAAIGFVLLFLQGGLVAVMAWYLGQSILPFMGACFLVGSIVYGLVRKRRSPVLVATIVGSLVALSPVLVLFKVAPLAYPVSLGDVEPAAHVRLPMDTLMYVAWGGDAVSTNYHAASPDQRWAYDLVVAPFFTASDSLGDYGCYGLPVLAPAAGVVDVSLDGRPDAPPGRLSYDLANPLGNYVSIRLRETGAYLILAHLQPGSVRVAPGDTLREGQPIGRCGNSGNTSEPHVHIHHQRQSPSETPIGFAEGLPLYFRDVIGPAMPVGGFRIEGNRAIMLGDSLRAVLAR
ncbi:MAG: M23 family metallopeptidase [Rhodothermales bacterium]